jgi:hypothetical protein
MLPPTRGRSFRFAQIYHIVTELATKAFGEMLKMYCLR